MASPSLRISASFLNNLRAIYPEPAAGSLNNGALSNPWYIVAAVAFSASNRPEGVPCVFQHALEDLRSKSRVTTTTSASPATSKSDERLLAQKMREAIFKAGLITGYSRAINGLRALHEVMPEEYQEKEIQRKIDTPLSDFTALGDKLFREMYGETADSVQSLLDAVYPDMGWFSKTIGYGVTYGHTDILSGLETSYAIVAALIAADTPQQIIWHQNNARRQGGTLEEVQAVKTISIEVAKASGIRWLHEIPEV